MSIPTEYYKVIRREPSLVGYWRLNDLNGTRAIDWAGRYNINGIYNGNPINNVPLIAKDNDAGSKLFGSVNQNVEIPDATPLRITGDITIEGWMISLEARQQAYLVSKMIGLQAWPYYVRLASATGKLLFSMGGTEGFTTVTSSIVIPLSIPIHFVATSFKNKMKIYINGVEVGSGINEEGSRTDGGNPLYMGETGQESHGFNGMLGELALYNSALGASTIRKHFSIGRQIIFQKPYYTTYDPPSYS